MGIVALTDSLLAFSSACFALSFFGGFFLAVRSSIGSGLVFFRRSCGAPVDSRLRPGALIAFIRFPSI